jgi:hypothetical protein
MILAIIICSNEIYGVVRGRSDGGCEE